MHKTTAQDREQSLGEHRRRRYTRTRKCYYIWHGRSKITSMVILEPVEDRAIDTEQDERKVSKMLWSMVSKAAERRQTWQLLWSYCTDDVIVNIQKASFSGMFTVVGRLVITSLPTVNSSSLLEVRRSVRWDLTMRSIILDMRERLEIGR